MRVESKGGRGLPGRGVCLRKYKERKNTMCLGRLILLEGKLQGKGVLSIEAGTTVSSRLKWGFCWRGAPAVSLDCVLQAMRAF